MYTWDEVITWYEMLQKGSEGYDRSKLAGCMAQMLPLLRQAVEKRIPGVRLATIMLAVELKAPNTSQVVVVQCVDECQFVLTTKNNRNEVLQESAVDMDGVVEQTIQYLEMTKHED